jgi:hypothetical protein
MVAAAAPTTALESAAMAIRVEKRAATAMPYTTVEAPDELRRRTTLMGDRGDMLFGARTTRNERRGGIIPNPSQQSGRGGGVAVLEGGVQPNGEEGRYNTQPIPNIRLCRQWLLRKESSPYDLPLVSGPHVTLDARLGPRAPSPTVAGPQKLKTWHPARAAITGLHPVFLSRGATGNHKHLPLSLLSPTGMVPERGRRG